VSRLDLFSHDPDLIVPVELQDAKFSCFGGVLSARKRESSKKAQRKKQEGPTSGPSFGSNQKLPVTLKERSATSPC